MCVIDLVKQLFYALLALIERVRKKGRIGLGHLLESLNKLR